ncbi:MAG: VWA domain-containing protein [Planctomycetota bacterium]|nr:VWA domain-containing protein [Planctomycetota bacterium]
MIGTFRSIKTTCCRFFVGSCRGHECKRSLAFAMGTAVWTVAVLVLSGAAWGQVAVQMPPGVSEPTTLLLRDGTPWKVWVAFDGYELRDSASDKAQKLLSSKPLEFLYPYQVAMLWPQQNPLFALLATTADGKTVGKLEGWCPLQYLTTNAAQRVPTSKVYRKAAIINKEEFLTITFPKGSKPSDVTEIPPADFLTQPVKGGRHRKELAQAGLFSIFFVFAETDKYVLLGATARFPSDDAAVSPNIYGWVDKLRVSRWNTREGVSWNTETLIPTAWHDFWKYRQGELDKAQAARDKAKAAHDKAKAAVDAGGGANNLEDSIIAQYQAKNPGKTCPTKDDVEALNDNKAKKTKLLRAKAQVFKEPKDAYGFFTRTLDASDIVGKTGFTEGLRFVGNEDFRYPVVEWTQHEEEFKFPGNNRLVKVGAVGDFVVSGKPAESQERYGTLMRQLARAQELIGHIDLLFVVDDTDSMRSYFKTVAATIQEIVALARKATTAEGKPGNVRVSVCYYNDIDPLNRDRKTSPVNIQPFRAIDDAKFAALIKEVEGHRYRGGGPDIEEMVFTGIVQAIANAGVEPSSRKILIVIGDEGDKSAHLPAAERRKAVESVQRKLVSEASGAYEFYAIQMKHANTGPLFAEQMNDLATFVRDSRKDQAAAVVTAATSDDLKQVILERYNTLVAQEKEFYAAIALRRRGMSARVAESSSKIDPGLENRLKTAGVDVELLKQAQFNQVYEEGYVGMYPLGAEGKVKQLRSWAMLSEAEVKELIEILDKLVGDPGIISPVDLADVYKSLIAKLTGDPKVTTLKDAVLQRTGLELQSPISKLTAQEVLRGLPPDDKLEAQCRLLQLRDATKDRRREYYVFNEPQKSGPPLKVWKFRNEREEQRYFTVPGNDTHYFWIDVQTEMP